MKLLSSPAVFRQKNDENIIRIFFLQMSTPDTVDYQHMFQESTESLLQRS
jgi:hypothetical protein